ncbi:HBL038Cp [Eremothecium sinecaudum]|uniref:HBL038Cp n=1 Tax=Eremothecium sinecaudum TaxID=45286 RepID=A0A109UWL3_9SACH|nr:HBL038Cp [Eremothecium sinecaudum]AMD18864.1 HBL038Cp [Eremothecium sinecaudum]
MKFILIDANGNIYEGWKRWLSDWPSVVLHQGTLKDVVDNRSQFAENETRALVSPGNSFGFLQGGFDYAILKHFGGPQFEEFLQGRMVTGYRPVTTCSVYEIEEPFTGKGFNYLLHSPTMLAPCRPVFEAERPVETGIRLVFDTMWNILNTVPEDVKELVIPGLATGYAGIPAEIATLAMAFAIRLYILRDVISTGLMRVLIMRFMGYDYEPFEKTAWRQEMHSLGLNFEHLDQFNVYESSIDDILPRSLVNRLCNKA